MDSSVQNGYCTVPYSVDGSNREVLCVQDHFGGAYRCFQQHQKIGGILAASISAMGSMERSTSDKNHYEQRFKVLRKVHVNTVLAVMRKIGNPKETLHKGYWYEIHAD